MANVADLRQVILDNLRDGLEGVSIYDSLSSPWDDEVSLPGISVTVERIDVERPSANAQWYRARIGIQLVTATQGDTPGEAAASLDALEEAALRAVLIGTWPEWVEDVEWTGTTRNYATEAKCLAAGVTRLEVKAVLTFTRSWSGKFERLHVDVDHERDGDVDVQWRAEA